MAIQYQTHKANWISLLEHLITAHKYVQQWTSLQTHFFLPLLLSCEVVPLIHSHTSCQPESQDDSPRPSLLSSTPHKPDWITRPAEFHVHLLFFKSIFSSLSSVPPWCSDPSYFSPECSQSPADQFSCPYYHLFSNPFCRDYSKARTWTLSCRRSSRTAICFRKRLGCVLIPAYFCFLFPIFPNVSSLLHLVNSHFLLKAQFNGHSSMKLSLAFLA